MRIRQLALLLCVASLAHAQPVAGHFTLHMEGGISKPGVVMLGSLAGGSSLPWKSAFIFGGGGSYQVSQRVSFQMNIETAAHHRDVGEAGPFVLNAPIWRVYDISVTARFHFPVVYLFAGVLLSHQHTDEVVLRYFDNSLVTEEATSQFDLGSVWGAGLAVPVTSQVSLFGQGSFRFRSYNSLVGEIGCAYAL